MYESSPTPPTASDPESLLGHAAWIRRLARALVKGGDPAADSDDVEQQTWLAALRSSRNPTSDERPNQRGWLRAVARNVARRFARDHAARQRREESTASEEALAPVDDAVARAELHGKVVAAVLALAEPYRSTLIRRFLDERSPSQIAALDHVPVETVKTRLKRGLALLRDRFAKDLGEPRGDERDWRQALLALFPPGATESAVLVGSGAAIAISMKWKLLAATLMALVTFGILVSWKSERGGIGPNTADSVGAEPGRTASSPTPAVVRELLEASVAAALPADEPRALREVPRFRVAGIVRDTAGAPVADAWVWFTDARAAWTRDPTAWFGVMATWTRAAEPAGFEELPRTRTDHDGRFEFVSADRASWRVAAWHADAGAALSDERQPDRSRPATPAAWVDLTLRPMVGLRGRFVDERGAPVPQATLHLTVTDGSGPIRLEYPLPWRRRDDATFELPPMPALKFSGSSSALGYAAVSFEIDTTSPPRIREVDLVLRREPGQTRVGRIDVANGTGSLADDLLPNRREWELDGTGGQPSARVACTIVRFETEPPLVGTRLVRGGDRAGEVHLADGTYVVDRSLFQASSHVGLVVREVVVAVARLRPEEPAPDLRVDAALVPREPVTGVLRVRLRGAQERARDRAGESLWVAPFGGTSGGGLWMPIDAESSPGELRVDHVPAGRVAVHYTLPGVVRIAGETDVAAGCETSLDLELRSGTTSVHGFVEGKRGAPLRRGGNVKLYARREGRTVLPALAVADVVSEQFFSFDSLAPGEYALLWQRSSGPAVAIVTANEDPEPVVLHSTGGIDVTIAAHFETGEPPEAMSLRILRMDGTPEFDEIGTLGWDLDAGGERAVKVSPGRHLVQLFAEGAEAAEAELDTRVATRLDVPLRRR